MFNLFQKKSKNEQEILNLKNELYNDFISILEDFQNTIDSNLQWKRKQLVLKNEVNLTKEVYEKKIEELNTNGE